MQAVTTVDDHAVIMAGHSFYSFKLVRVATDIVSGWHPPCLNFLIQSCSVGFEPAMVDAFEPGGSLAVERGAALFAAVEIQQYSQSLGLNTVKMGQTLNRREIYGLGRHEA